MRASGLIKSIRHRQNICRNSTAATDATNASMKALPRAEFVEGRYRSPWDHLTRKGLFNIFKSMLYREHEIQKIESPKFSISHNAIARYSGSDLVKMLGNVSRMHFSWLGHSTCYVNIGGCYLLTDPVWCHRVSPSSLVGPARYMLPLLEVEDLPRVDVVLLSHTHYDHLDLVTAGRIGNKALWIVPMGVKALLRAIGITNVVELTWWQSHSVTSREGAVVKVTFTPTQHWTARTLFDRNTCLWGSFAVTSPAGSFFFGGDTAACAVFKLVGELYGPFDLAALPIGAYKPRSFTQNVHCNPAEAVQMHKDLRAVQSVGIHWGTYPLTDEDAVEPPLELGRARMEANVSVRDFFTVSLGEVIYPGDEPKEDFAELNPELYSYYVEQIWRGQPAYITSRLL